jgi:hypothetical protein
VTRSLPPRPPLVCIAEAEDALEDAWMWARSQARNPRAATEARAALVRAGAAVAEALAALDEPAAVVGGPEGDE